MDASQPAGRPWDWRRGREGRREGGKEGGRERGRDDVSNLYFVMCKRDISWSRTLNHNSTQGRLAFQKRLVLPSY